MLYILISTIISVYSFTGKPKEQYFLFSTTTYFFWRHPLMCIVLDVLYKSPAGGMLCQFLHSLLLLPASCVRPLLHELLSLLPHLDKLNSLLPAASALEQQELNWPMHGRYCINKLNSLLPAASALEQQELNWPMHGRYCINKLSSLLPAASALEQQELNWPMHSRYCINKLSSLLPAASALEQQELNWPMHGR